MNENLEKMRHSLAHIMAQAVLKVYPETKLAIGPDIDNGFYYDFDLGDKSFIPEDLKKIEKEMKKIVANNQKFENCKLTIEEAKEKLKNNPYKLELIEELEKQGESEISFYKNIDGNGNVVFEDMCRGPHVDSTNQVGAFKLQKLAGAYWRGDEKNKMLQRIYGLAFATEEELNNYVEMLKEAEKRDHRVIGKNLFLIDRKVGQGLVCWKPKGAMLWRIIEDFWYKAHLENGYQLVRSPHIGSRELWETSGHWNFYNDSMYPVLEVSKSLKEAQEGIQVEGLKEEYLLKPMNCPFHVQIFKSEQWSYRDLPLRWAECGTVYRYEKSGELSGLTRVRGFTQDDAHIICSKEQVEEELKRVANFIKFIFDSFGFAKYKIYLSLRDPKNKDKYAGNDEGWEFTENLLEKVAKDLGIEYEKEYGEAAFYGPKLDYKVRDALGREWQCSTLQFDFNLPERFDMTFVNADGENERPYMLHRALFGSFERFIGLLIEHYTGLFPVWLSPCQIKLISVGEKHHQYVMDLADQFKKENFRVEMDMSNETVGNKIRRAEQEKVPYMLVIGDKEIESGEFQVRLKGEDEQRSLKLEQLIDEVKQKIEKKK